MQFRAPPVEYLPASHVPEHLAAPQLLSYLPPAQSSHTLLPVAACAVPYLHITQEPLPVLAAYLRAPTTEEKRRKERESNI